MRVEPIRDSAAIQMIIAKLRADTSPQGSRRYLLWLSGIYLGRRVSDILQLKVRDVRGQTKIRIRERKTKKRADLYIAPELQAAYNERLADADPDDYVFKSPQFDDRPITRRTAYRDMQRIKELAELPDGIGTHSMRKTFGYHYYQKTHDIATLMTLFNHSSERTTLIYIGIMLDEIKAAYTQVAMMYK